MRALFLSAFAVLFCLTFKPVAAHAQLRPMVYTDKIIDAPIDIVWEDWTTAEGLESFFASKAIVETRPGGAYELWFAPEAPKGQRGAEDGIIIGLQNEDDGTRMISFTWAMPPYMEDIRPHMTIVQLWFMPLPNGKTRLRLFHTGFGDTPAWQKGRDYFAKTWPDVMARYDAHINDEALNHGG